MDFEFKDNLIEDFDQSEEDLSSYDIKLKDFDGPFDTLCHLIKKSKYSIEDVKISDITCQYMDYMKQIDQLDLEKATGFITMAAWLLEIKSKTLLPRPQVEQQEEDDPERVLKQQLAEYALFKDASNKLKQIESVDMLYRSPDSLVGKPVIKLKSMDINQVFSALNQLLLKLDQRSFEIKERHILKDNFTVEEKVSYIKDRLTQKEFVMFSDLFFGTYNKSEVITTFQALLELLKLQYIFCEQAEIYGDIVLKRAENIAS